MTQHSGEALWRWGSVRVAIRTCTCKNRALPRIRIPTLRNRPMQETTEIQKFRSRPRLAMARTKTKKQRPPRRTKRHPRKKKLRPASLMATGDRHLEDGRDQSDLQKRIAELEQESRMSLAFIRMLRSRSNS